jgi:hypothetical protein
MHNITLDLPATENYTADSVTLWINVTEIPDQFPTVTLITPSEAKSWISDPTMVNFTCNSTDDYLLVNVTLYFKDASISWHANETKSISGTSNQTDFNKTLYAGDYEWNCYACDNASQCSFATSNRTFSISPILTELVDCPASMNVPENYDVQIVCRASNSTRISADYSVCTIDIYHPNLSKDISSASMEHISGSHGLYNYSYTSKSVKGVYNFEVGCSSGGSSAYDVGSIIVLEEYSSIADILSNQSVLAEKMDNLSADISELNVTVHGDLSFSFNYSRVASNIDAQNIFSNLSDINTTLIDVPQDVWNYTDRLIHGFE